MPQLAALPLHPEALDANRAGRLTDAQLASLRRYDRGPRGNNLWVAVFCVIVAVVLFGSRSPARNAALRPYAGVGALLIAGGLVLRTLGIGGRLARDLRAGRVEAIDGAITKVHHSFGTGGPAAERHELQVAGQRFSVLRGTYAAAPDAGIVRLYYLPTSRHVVNLERLPDRPLPAGALESPRDVLESLGASLRSRGVAGAEARATVAAMESAMEREVTADPTPPPSAERDPRPLAEALAGRWRAGPVSIDFAPDGTVSLVLPGGLQRRGRWRIDASGRLHADGAEGEMVGDAWVVGDTLTIAAKNDAYRFRRA
jgi:hypothetical protein